MRKTAFLDRDGVINEDVNYLRRKEDIRLLEGSAEAIRILNENYFLTIVVSNQSAVARGMMSEKQVEEINGEIGRLIFEKSEGRIDKFYYCPHHPKADLEKYRIVCECRKPAPGMLRLAEKEYCINMKRSYMIGDMPSDIVAGDRAGCRTILLKSEKNKEIIQAGREFKIVEPDYKFNNLLEAVKFIIFREI